MQDLFNCPHSLEKQLTMKKCDEKDLINSLTLESDGSQKGEKSYLYK